MGIKTLHLSSMTLPQNEERDKSKYAMIKRNMMRSFQFRFQKRKKKTTKGSQRTAIVCMGSYLENGSVSPLLWPWALSIHKNVWATRWCYLKSLIPDSRNTRHFLKGSLLYRRCAYRPHVVGGPHLQSFRPSRGPSRPKTQKSNRSKSKRRIDHRWNK